MIHDATGRGSAPAEMVSAAMRGDPGAAERLWKSCAPDLMKVAVALAGSPADARELVQDALVAGFRYLPSYDPARPFRPWIHGILVNAFRRQRRRRWLRGRRFTSLDGNGLLRDTVDVEALLRARELRDRSLACLPQTQRLVWTLAVIAELDVAEIGNLLGKNPSTVRSHLSKARARIRKTLFSEEDKS